MTVVLFLANKVPYCTWSVKDVSWNPPWKLVCASLWLLQASSSFTPKLYSGSCCSFRACDAWEVSSLLLVCIIDFFRVFLAFAFTSLLIVLQALFEAHGVYFRPLFWLHFIKPASSPIISLCFFDPMLFASLLWVCHAFFGPNSSVLQISSFPHLKVSFRFFLLIWVL